MPYTAGTYKKDFNKMSPRDQHFMAVYWAYLSIKRKEPTDDKVWELVDKYPDIQELRKILVKEMFDKEYASYVMGGDCEDKIAEIIKSKDEDIAAWIKANDELEDNIKNLEKEQIKFMDEQEKAIKIIDKEYKLEIKRLKGEPVTLGEALKLVWKAIGNIRIIGE